MVEAREPVARLLSLSMFLYSTLFRNIVAVTSLFFRPSKMNINFLIIALGSCLISAPWIQGQIITGGGKPLPPINGETISNRNSECFWAGTSPFCQAKCEAGFVTAKVDSKGDGAACLTGMKSLCCPEGTKLANAGGSEGGCYWAGTSPLCNAKCAKDFFVKKHSASGDGAGCLFGNKKFCCPISQQG